MAALVLLVLRTPSMAALAAASPDAPAADSAFDLDAPTTMPPSAPHSIRVLNDGIAHIHIKPHKGQSSESIDLVLSPLQAVDQSTVVIGFIDNQDTGPR